MKKLLAAILVMILIGSMTTAALAQYGAVASKGTALYTLSNLKGKAGKLSKYTAVVVGGVRSGIACIKHEGHIYFVSSKALIKPWKNVQARLEAHGISTEWEFNRYTKRSCYVYNYPSTGAARKRVKKNVDMMACYVRGSWTLVECNGYYGYIKSENLGMRIM